MGLIYNGKDISNGHVEVQDWTQHGMEYKLGRDSVRHRRQDPDLFVGHWSASENPAATLYANLKKRKTAKSPRGLSVHLYMDQKGKIWQFADLNLVCSHAGLVNERAIGIEIANKGTAPPLSKHKRAVWRKKYQGKERVVLGFFLEQTEAWVALAECLAAEGLIPRKIPRDKNGALLMAQSPKTIKSFTGACEHFHVSSEKIDAGGFLVEALDEDDWG